MLKKILDSRDIPFNSCKVRDVNECDYFQSYFSGFQLYIDVLFIYKRNMDVTGNKML